MQEQLLQPAEPGRRPAQQHFAGVDLRRPKGYVAPPSSPTAGPAAAAKATAKEGEPCPRCESRDTKFCYYNNYNTSQPRHFCKACRRYWTKGGTLRTVPVGGGTRKRPSSSSSSASSAAAVKQHKPYKKRRATPPEPTATTNDDVAMVVTAPDAASPKTTEPTTTTPPDEASASEITTELVVTAPAKAEEDSFTELLQHGGDDAVALDIGFSEYLTGGGKSLSLGDTYSFEWPPALDLGTYWGGADTDPAVFMNLP